MQAHHEQVLSLLQQLAREDQHHVRRVAHLRLLRLRRHDQQLRRRVHDLDLADDGRRVGRDEQPAEVVHHELVASCNSVEYARDRTRSRNAPLGPKLVRTRSESSETACIFLSTASSMPWH